MNRNLVDLNELVLSCKDEQAKAYALEAVASFHAGAYRAAIISAWIAVVFDFVEKLRQLDLTGDKNARKKLEEFEKIQKVGDVRGALDFERSVLDWAKDEFEFLTPLEYQDLRRLAEDRNRCAHPSMNSLEEAYQPPAELARFHIRNAITHMLQRPPVQGKAALDRLLKEVSSDYFPDEWQQALEYFKGGPLGSPRDSLVRNFVIVLLKGILQSDLSTSAKQRHTAALAATLEMHREITEETFRERLNDLVRALDDGSLGECVRLLGQVSATWQFFENDVRTRVENYIENSPNDEIRDHIPLLLQTEQFRENALDRISQLGFSDLYKLALQEPREEYVQRGLEIYEGSATFDSANKRSALVLVLIPCLKAEDVERIIQAASENAQVLDSFQWPRVRTSLRRSNKVSEEQFDDWLMQYELIEEPTRDTDEWWPMNNTEPE